MGHLLKKSQTNIRIANLLINPEHNPTKDEWMTEQAAYHACQGIVFLLKAAMEYKKIPYAKSQNIMDIISKLDNTGFFIEERLKEQASAMAVWEERCRNGEDLDVEKKDVERTVLLYKSLWDKVRAEFLQDGWETADEAGFTGRDREGEQSRPRPLQDEMVAYVDGSYNVSTGEFSYGVVAFVGEDETHLSQKMDDEELAAMRNVAGEIKGSEAAMRYALEKGCKKVTIYYDYEGIAKWCLGEWKTNREGTKAYKRFYDHIKDGLEVEFVKVKGHSNDKYNDLADELAKKALQC